MATPPNVRVQVAAGATRNLRRTTLDERDATRGSPATTDCVKTLTLKVRIIINVRECDQKGAALMDYIRGVSREQVMLFPESVEDYITEDNPVRFIDAFVSGLDLAGLGFNRAQPAETGRPAYDPGDLLRLYLYGYLNRVQYGRHAQSIPLPNGSLKRNWLA